MSDVSGIDVLRDWIAESRSAVFFGGAGVSTGSGIPDFRGEDGLYRQQWDYPLEEILGISLFHQDPAHYYRYFRATHMAAAQPNVTHRRLAELEDEGHMRAVITQNIDGLHQKAGSSVVHELHGSLYHFYCARCRRDYGGGAVTAAVMAGGEGGSEARAGAAEPGSRLGADGAISVTADGVPRCDCGGVIRPTMVFYGEALDMQVVEDATRAIRTADLLIIGGTSLVVYPAAGMPGYYLGTRLVLINREPTPFDDRANLLLREDLGEVFSQV